MGTRGWRARRTESAESRVRTRICPRSKDVLTFVSRDHLKELCGAELVVCLPNRLEIGVSAPVIPSVVARAHNPTTQELEDQKSVSSLATY